MTFWYDAVPESEVRMRLRHAVLFFLAFLWCFSAIATAQEESDSPTQVSAPPVTTPVSAYTLSPDQLAKAKALYTVRTTLHFVETIYSIVLLLLILRFRLGPGFRDWAERATRFRFVQALISSPCLRF